MTTYILKVPPTMEQGSYNIEFTPSANETPAACALWYYNSARAHDGLDPIKRMPKGTQYTAKKEYILLADYGQGWEEETAEETRRDIIARLREYRENAPQFSYRWISRKVTK